MTVVKGAWVIKCTRSGIFAQFPEVYVAVFAVSPQCDMPGFSPQSTGIVAFVFKCQWKPTVKMKTMHIKEEKKCAPSFNFSLLGLRNSV